ncbi:hypothetical protein BB558_000042 [Smittium angustum]|uniref:Uncharacterized protein n=1 Tax=Smittium angustum TaxID=133377 RepID=A0A2U1JF79_SMIAN|nr:hypothetical protein BB558_000042 [Smittium angustum]
MIIAFLVDTSWSMGRPLNSSPAPAQHNPKNTNIQTTHNYKPHSKTNQIDPPTRLDCAKGIVEQIIHKQGSQPNNRYLLVTYDENENSCIKCTLKDSSDTFLEKLKALKPVDRFNGGNSLSVLFQQLRLLRLTYDIDTFGRGRYPCLNEITYIFWLTDGASMVSKTGILDKLNIPINQTTWSDMHQEPFRWDQKLITIFLHEQGDPELCYKGSYSSEHLLSPMSAVMSGSGGVHHVGSMKQAQRFIEILCPMRRLTGTKATSGTGIMSTGGVVVSFEKLNNDPSSSTKTEQKVLLIAPEANILSGPLNTKGPGLTPSVGASMISNGSAGYFPIPESFWIDSVVGNTTNSLPDSQHRAAHPTLLYSETPIQWSVPSKFPFDKFQIDSNSKVCQSLLAATNAAFKANPEGPPLCWPIYVANSYRANNAGFPFGLLRSNSARNAVNLFVLPYNFPALFILLRRYESLPKPAGFKQWKIELDEYLSHTPGYYTQPLRRAFGLYGIQKGLISENYGNSNMISLLSKFTAEQTNLARVEWDSIEMISNIENESKVDTNSNKKMSSDISPLISNPFDVPRSKISFTLDSMRKQMVQSIVQASKSLETSSFELPDALVKICGVGIKTNIGPKLLDSDLIKNNTDHPFVEKKEKVLEPSEHYTDKNGEDTHNVPISIMGNYQEVLSKQQLQEFRDPLMPDETLKFIRKTMFGNPYRRQPKPSSDYPQPKGQSIDIFSKTKPGIPSNLPKDTSLSKSPESMDIIETITLDELMSPDIIPTKLNGSVDESDGIRVTLGLDVNSEIDGEAQLNESGIADGNLTYVQGNTEHPLGHKYTKYGWVKKRSNIPRYRTVLGPVEPNNDSWNVNPWDTSDDNSKVTKKAKTKSSTPPEKSSAKITKTPQKKSATPPPTKSVPIPENKDKTQKSDFTIGRLDYIDPALDRNNSIFKSGTPFNKNEVLSNPKSLDLLDALKNTRKSLPNTSKSSDHSSFSESRTEITTENIIKNETTQSSTTETVKRPYTLRSVDTASVPVKGKDVERESRPTRQKKTPAQLKMDLVKLIKLDAKRYNEASVLEAIVQLNPDSPLYTKDQKKAIANACLAAAKPLRRKSLITKLDLLIKSLGES